MKVLLYFEGEKVISKSGIGRAMKHQMAALTSQGIEYTLDPDDDYDILHINTIGPNSSPMIRKARHLNRKIVYHAHSTEEDFRNSFMLSNQIAPLFKKRLVHLYSKADHIITPTPYSKKLIESYGIDLPIHAISNGIDLEKFNYNEDKIKAFHEYFNIKDEKVIICVGLFFVRKGILDFIEVAKRLPEYKFIWFGHVPLYSIPKQIRDIVTKDHPDNVIFPGYVSGPVIEGAYCGADAFFFPSMEETEGIVVLEALASYQQVILRDIPVFDPWMKDKVNCYKGHDVDSFTKLVDDVVCKRLPDVSAEGRKTAMERSIPEVGKQLRQVYEAVLKD
ncbi:glycosyltransferase family 4 protein [[Eubacterium] hominis]|uniref:glycosyltransferase family 4 protein n=1 Tax=[Eubacterium] hominis TaxID=2764325 RepID=UPI003A4E6480